MGTHSDGKSVSSYGFPGKYWETKEIREAEKEKEDESNSS